MNQTRGEWNSLVLRRANFWRIWRYHDILCFHIYFLFRTNGKWATRWKRLPSLLWYFFRKYHSETTWSSHVQSSFATITRHFDNGIWNDTLQLKILRTWITIWTDFSLSKYLQTKIGEDAWTHIIYTIIRACSSKNIAPRHFTYYCMLLFLSNKPSLKISLFVLPIIFSTVYLPFYFLIFCVFWS